MNRGREEGGQRLTRLHSHGRPPPHLIPVLPGLQSRGQTAVTIRSRRCRATPMHTPHKHKSKTRKEAQPRQDAGEPHDDIAEAHEKTKNEEGQGRKLRSRQRERRRTCEALASPTLPRLTAPAGPPPRLLSSSDTVKRGTTERDRLPREKGTQHGSATRKCDARRTRAPALRFYWPKRMMPAETSLLILAAMLGSFM